MANKQIKDKNGGKYNNDGFINIAGYLSQFDKNGNKKAILCILNSPRNIGKTYGTGEHIEKNIGEASNWTKRIAYVRTNKQKLKHAIEDFNAKYRGRYYMNETKIYKQTFKDDGKEVYSKRVEVGSVLTIEQAENYKSMHFDNYVMFFGDEYNEFAFKSNQWFKFIDLMKTVKRFNKQILFLLVGNKVNANSPILNILQIDLSEINNTEDDYLLKVDHDIWFIDIGFNTFAQANDPNDLANKLASYDASTHAYMNEGIYLVSGDDQVIIYDKYVKPTKRVLKYFTFMELKLEYGRFVMNNEVHVYFREVRTIPAGYFGYSMDIMGYMKGDKAGYLIDKETLIDFANEMKVKAKQKRLWYCSYDVKLAVEPWIRINCTGD